MKRGSALSMIPALVLLAPASAQAQTSTDRNVIAAGAVAAHNTSLQLTGTLGQPIIGTSVTLHRTAWQGFWYSESSAKASVPVPGNATALLDCSPNPIGRSGTISMTVPSDGTVVLTLHDLLGRTVQRLVEASRQAGEYSVELNVEDIPEGRYTLRLTHSLGENTLPVLVVK